jgi:uncharacterized repeat protein (TIGR03806 family)
MKKHFFFLALSFSALLAVVFSCSSSDDGGEYVELSPVVMDLTQVPYPKLSDYKFFEGNLADLQPALRVLPYELNSELFTDYALKKRFVWMPGNVKATYSDDDEVVNFPMGAALIKNFFYESEETSNGIRLIETRIMIKKEGEWIFATYVWNPEQTEAYLDNAGSTVRVSWEHNGETKSTNYKIPSEFDCKQCHALNDVPAPIGPKPQNLNRDYAYAGGSMNQLEKWKKTGYLNSYAAEINTTVDWTDTSQPLEVRVRSYLDVNCAHCHRPENWAHPGLNFQFSETIDPMNLGVCVEPLDFVSGEQTHIVNKGNVELSLMPYRMSTNVQSEMMPVLGRTVAHEEGVALIEEWINSLEGECP